MQSESPTTAVTKTNWNHLVGYDENEQWSGDNMLDAENRRIDTCVLCGDMKATNRKFVDIKFMEKAINTRTNIFKGTYMQSVYNNICDLIKIHNTAFGKCDVCVCINCYYWTKRHKENNLIPTMYLKWYMNTLHNGSWKCFDKRVLWRICKTLDQIHENCTNYYLTIFSIQEIETIKRVAASDLDETSNIIQEFYKEQTAKSLFHEHKLGAKMVRDSGRKEM